MSSTLPAALNLSSANMTFGDELDTFTSSPYGTTGYRTTYPFGGSLERTLPFNGEQEYYSDSSVGVDPFSDTGGVLDIKATAATPGSNPGNLPYNSGLVTTQGMFQQEYGYFEATVKAPAGAGLWAGFWMLPYDNLGGAELDVFEILGSYPNVLYTTTHSVNGNGVHTANSIPNPQSVNLTAGFHTYGVDWEPTQITWYLDGQAVVTQTTPPNFNTPMYMILNLALGGFGGTPDPKVFPADMQIDSVHAYATANTIRVSGSAVIQTASVAGLVRLAGAALGGVAVSLVDAAGTLLATAVTDVNGYFIFTQLAASTYRVLYQAPAGTAPQPGGLADGIGGVTAAFTLATGQQLALGAENLVAATLASLGGVVVKQTGSAPGQPVSGETVKLLRAGSVVATTLSRPDGTFVFANLAAGAYTVQYTTQAAEVLQAGGPANTKTGLSASVSLGAGQAASMAVQTITPAPGAVSGTVLYTATAMQGIKGVPLPGATVTLLDDFGAVVASAATDANGAFYFSNVMAGQYHMVYSSSDGYVFLSGSYADPLTGRGGTTIFVTSGNRTVAPTETIAAAASVASLAGTVRFADGVHPATPLAGVLVTIADTSGRPSGTVTTDANGAYSFVNLGPGTYQFLFSAPSGDAFQAGGPANIATGTTGPVTLVSGQAYTLPPETLIVNAPATIAGTVLEMPTYTTAAGTGLALAGETVTLLGATSGLVVATTTTDAAGGFLFAGLVAGFYVVRYAIPADASLQAGGPAGVTTAKTATLTVQAGQSLVVAAETLVPLPASITGSVSYNGAPVSYVGMALVDASGATVATAVTNYTGAFSFSGLVAGTYRIRYTPAKTQALLAGPADPASGLTAGIALAAGAKVTLAAETLKVAPASVASTVVTAAGLGQAGVAVAALNTADGSVAGSAVTSASGTWQIAGLAPGSYQLRYTVPAGEVLQGGANATTGLTTAFPLGAGQALGATHVTVAPIAPAALGGSVLASLNGKAVAQAGATVTLVGSGGTLTTTTSASGAFQFRGLVAGSYQLRYAAPAGDSLQAGGPADAASGLTAALTLAAGQTLTLTAETIVVPPAALAGSVLYAGVGAPAGEGGVVVSLLQGGQAVASTATDASGAFGFTGLGAGPYQISYAAPSGQLLAAGGPADPATGRTAALTLQPGQTTTLSPETLAPAPGFIGGTVLLAGAGGTAPGAGVTVALLASGGTQPLASTTTDAQGVFQFAGLAAGSYVVSYAAPAGQALQPGGPANAAIGAASGQTAPIALSASQTDVLAPQTLVAATASLSGSVALAGTSQAGVSVKLLGPGGATLATTTTDAGGAFRFSRLPAGSYCLCYAAPAGDALQAGGPADAATGVTAAYTLADGQAMAVPGQGLVALSPGIAGMVTHVGSGDPGTGLGGVTVSLLNAGGTVLRTAVTRGSGAFSFQSVAAGSYRLRYAMPAGEAVQPGGAADPATATTGLLTYAAGQAMTLATQNVVSSSTSFTLTGPAAAAIRGDGSYTVTGNASSGSLRLGNGNQSVTLTGFADTVVTGNGNQTISLAGAMNTIATGDGTQTVTAGSAFATVTLGNTTGGNTSTVVFSGSGNKLVAGDGSVSVSGTTGASSVTLGAGNHSIVLGGSGNTVTVGAGSSTIGAGQNNNVVHAAGGDTISVTGQGNLLDAGPGMNFYNPASTSRLDVFMLNASGQGLTTITGFNMSDTLDLARTVAGLGVLADLSNLGHFVTSGVSNGSTILFVDPAGGAGTPYAFATLSNVATSVAQLVAGHAISLT